MPHSLLTRYEDSMLQMEMSAVIEGSVMDVSAEMELKITGHPLMTSTPKKERKKERKKKERKKKKKEKKKECPACGKSHVQKRNLVRHRKHKLDDGPCFPCSQCHKKCSHMNSVHLKMIVFKCKTCKRLFAHKRSLEPGRHSCTVNAWVHVCGHCGKVFESRGNLSSRPCTLAWRQSSLPLQQVPRTFQIQESAEAS